MLTFTKYLVILSLLIIVGSLFSALTFLVKDRGDKHSTRMVRALSIRVGLSIGLFLFLAAGFYFGFLPSSGLRPSP